MVRPSKEAPPRHREKGYGRQGTVMVTEAPVSRRCPAQCQDLSVLTDLPPRGLRELSCLLGLFLSQFSTQGCHDVAVLASPVFQPSTLQKDMLLKAGLITEAEQIFFFFWPLLCRQLSRSHLVLSEDFPHAFLFCFVFKATLLSLLYNFPPI